MSPANPPNGGGLLDEISGVTGVEYGAAASVDISGLPFEFNPPLHKANFHIRTEFSTSDSAAISRVDNDIYRQDKVKAEGVSFGNQRLFRTGRLTMGDVVENSPVMEGKRWGFRFPFNPESWGGGSKFQRNIIPSFSDVAPLIVSAGMEVIQLRLFLDRVPDVMGPAMTTDYHPVISQDQLNSLKVRGTNYDIEYLYRVTNVQRMNTLDGQNTADFGILLPIICYLHIGGMRLRGRVQTIQVNHVLFSPEMVPIRSQVAVNFQRIPQMNEEEFITWAEAGGWNIREHKAGSTPGEAGGAADSGTGGTGSAPSGNYSGDTLAPEKIFQLCKEVGFNDQQAEIFVNIAWGESTWRTAPTPHPPCCWGLFQVNWNAHSSWLKRDYGATRAEDLHDPVLNARASKKIFDDAKGRYSPWEAYTKAGWGNWKWKWRR